MYVKTGEKVGIGYRFGMLTVVEKMPIRKKSYAVWRCVCECGGETNLDTGTIRSGKIIHCGCKPSVKPGTLDLIGQRFGKLVAIEPTEKRTDQGSVVWKCICDCGKEKEVSARRLIRGKVRSCGCLSNPPLKDYIGKRFGRLTILEFAGRLSKTNKEIFWRCLCDCGNETIVGQTELQNGDTQSCGCYKRDQIRKGTNTKRPQAS